MAKSQPKTITKEEFLKDLDKSVDDYRLSLNPSHQLTLIADDIRTCLDTVNTSIIEIGKALIEAKALCKHGEWEKWLEKNFEWTDQTARNFMSVAKQFGDGKSKDVFAFDKHALFLLSRPSTPEAVREEALALASAGEKVTHKRAKSLIDHAGVKQSQRVEKALPARSAATPEPRAAESKPKSQYVYRNMEEYVNHLQHTKRLKSTVPNSPEHAKEIQTQIHKLNHWYYYNVGEPWPVTDEHGNLLPPTNPDPVPLPQGLIDYLERERIAAEVSAAFAPPPVIDVTAETISEAVETIGLIPETVVEDVVETPAPVIPVEPPAVVEAPSPALFDGEKKRRLNSLLEELDELSQDGMTDAQRQKHAALLTQFEAFDSTNAKDAKWLGLLELTESLYDEVSNQILEGPLPDWDRAGEWFVTLDSGEIIKVKYTPDRNKFLDGFEFRGEISTTGYISDFARRNRVFSVFEFSKNRAEELRAKHLKECKPAAVLSKSREELRHTQDLLEACKRRYQSLEAERDQLRQELETEKAITASGRKKIIEIEERLKANEKTVKKLQERNHLLDGSCELYHQGCDTLTGEQVHLIEILVNRFDWTPEQMTDLEHAMQEHFPGWKSCKYL